MDQEYIQQEDAIVAEDIEKFNQEYAAKLSLEEDYSLASKTPSAPLILSSSQSAILDENFAANIHEYNNINFTLSHWDSIVNALFSQDIVQQHYGIIGIRKILSIENQPPIQKVIDTNLVPRLMLYAKQSQYLHIKFEALWALTNVASGNTQQTQIVVNEGGIQLFIECLDSPVLSIVEQAIWAIGNLAGDNIGFRDMLIMHTALEKLVILIAQNFYHKSLTRNGIWALCNLCRGNPRPSYALIKNGINLCCRYIVQKDVVDTDNLTQILWVLAYPQQIKDNLELQFASKLVTKISLYISSPFISIVIPTIRFLSNLFENQAFADCFIKNRWIELLIPLLSHKKVSIRRQVCFLISRLTDIHNYDVSDIFVNPSIVQTLFKMFKEDDFSVKLQIAYLFANLCCHDEIQKVYNFYRQTDILQYYAALLTSKDKLLLPILESIDSILKVGQKFTDNGVNNFALRIEELNAITELEKLQYNPNENIYQKAKQILENYFCVEDEGQVPNQTNNINNSFGLGPAAAPGFGFSSNHNNFQF